MDTEVWSIRRWLERRKIQTLGCILVNMSGDRLSIDSILGNPFLIDTHGSDGTQSAGVDLGTAIGNDAHYDFLPSILTPGFAPISLAQMGDIFHNAMHGSGEELLVFVVHGENDEEFCPSGRVVQNLTQSETRVFEIVGIASCS